MVASKNAVAFIESEEGCILHAYLDKAGKWTIGIGCRTMSDGSPVKKGDTITRQQAEDMLAKELRYRADAISQAVGSTVLTQNQFDALCSFVFNVGVEGFKDSTLLRFLKADPLNPSIRDAFCMWDKRKDEKGMLVVDQGLLARRKREANFYFQHTNI